MKKKLSMFLFIFFFIQFHFNLNFVFLFMKFCFFFFCGCCEYYFYHHLVYAQLQKTSKRVYLFFCFPFPHSHLSSTCHYPRQAQQSVDFRVRPLNIKFKGVMLGLKIFYAQFKTSPYRYMGTYLPDSHYNLKCYSVETSDMIFPICKQINSIKHQMCPICIKISFTNEKREKERSRSRQMLMLIGISF